MKKPDQKQSNEFKILDEISYILLRPDIFIGSTKPKECGMYLNYTYSNISYNPGLFKIINELIDNSVDEHIRTDGKFATKIDITMDDKTFSVTDNGRGIPVDKVVDSDGKELYRPEAAWCRTKAGTNFNDDANRVTTGMNGVGSALCNIFSKIFIGETSDGKKKFYIKCIDNAKVDQVKITNSNKNYTTVYIEPDFERFKVNGFDDTIKNMIKDRLLGLAMCYPLITFKFNGESIKSLTGKQFLSKFDENITSYIDDNCIVGFMPNESSDIKHYSIVNGLRLYSGGNHVDFFLNNISGHLREMIKKKYKFDVAPAKIKSSITLISIIKNFKNMSFETQSKEKLTNTNQEITAHLGNINFETIAKNIFKNEKLIDPIIESFLAKKAAEDAAEERRNKKALKQKKVAKHIPATANFFEKKTLFITEGDSAIGQFVSVRNAETQGAIPLRGKVLNTFGKPNKEILQNEALADLMSVIGLELGKPAKNLNYGTIAIMTDQDLDGGAIRCQLINFFYNWPELFRERRIKLLNSPIYILRGKKDRHYFYSKSEFEKFNKPIDKYDLVYIKGLGSLRIEEYKDIINDPYYETVSIDDAQLFELMYGKDSDKRKEYMMS